MRHLNAGFHHGVARGIARSVALNYWVAAGVYDPATCVDFEATRGEGVVAERLVVRPATFRAAPAWVDPVIGRSPRGRVYALGVDEVQTLVSTGARRTLVHDLHTTVDRKGHAHLFLRCA